jgi:hypothetical protein
MADPRIWYDPPPFSWGRVIRIGLTWVAVVVVLLVLLPSPPREEPVVARWPDAELPLPYAPAASRAAPRAAPAASAPARTAVAAVTATREIEACGGRRLKVAGDKPVDTDLLDQVDTRDLRLRSVTAMRYGGEAARAGAMLLESAGPAALETVANAAATGHDARAYGLAFRACGTARSSARGACQLVTADQWSRLDPDNAVPWLFVAAQAQQRGDAAGVSEAMQRVAKAKRADDGAGVLSSLVLQHAPRDDASLLPTVRLLADAVAQQAAWNAPAWNIAHTFCSDAAVRDPARRQTCSDIADLLVQRSTTLVEHGNGAAIGKRIGWSDEKLQALKTERDAIAEVNARADSIEGDAFSCAWARRSIAHSRSVAEQGEVEAGRVAIRQSGRDAEQWAKASRERSEKAPQARRSGG